MRVTRLQQKLSEGESSEQALKNLGMTEVRKTKDKK
jgi:hypothetical protein